MSAKTARTIWEGSGRDGQGKITSGSNALQNQKVSFKRRFGDEKGTNPEELIAAAHSACFSMALAFALDKAGHTASKLDTDAAVTIVPDGDGFRISKSALTLTANVPGIDEKAFGAIAQDAKANCPVSKLLNAEISLEWTLEGSRAAA